MRPRSLPVFRGFLPSLLSAALLLDVGPSLAQLPPAAAPAQGAAALFEQASAKLDAKDFAAACPMLEDVLRLEPSANGAQMALAECYEGAGRLASAWRAFARAGEQAAKIGRADRQSEAAAKTQALRPKLGGVILQLSPAARITPGLTITVDGAPLAQADWDKPYPADQGKRVVRAEASGKVPWERTVSVVDGATVSVALEAMVDILRPDGALTPQNQGNSGQAAGAGGPGTAPAGGGAGETGRGPGAPGGPTPAPEDRSHAGQIGVLARVDVDVLSGGAVGAVGVSYAPIAWVEVSATALLGKRAGLEVDVTGYLLRGAVKPLISVGAPVLFEGGPYAGVRGAAGVEWDPNRHFGIFATIGGAYFPEVPAGYTRDAVLAALGVQGRF